jgi:DNA-binding NarL/FixJ family response regulator
MSAEKVPDPFSTALLGELLSEIDIPTRRPTEPSSAVPWPDPSAGVADELSAREREVLRYLPTMLTISEIARELSVSVNTIKSHIRSIYRKLGATRRQMAVARAYEYGILRPTARQ